MSNDPDAPREQRGNEATCPVYNAPPEVLDEVAKLYMTPISQDEFDTDLRLVQDRASSLIKHVMRIRRRLEMRGVARSTAYWTAYAIGDGGIMPWSE